ncbi:MAG: hypothetical protein O9340_11355 [Cyclobacteriaceae bacterium]|jgi:hypothetical protein|nr:hypothetical protein [Cyclobacteriaceae bacterium]
MIKLFLKRVFYFLDVLSLDVLIGIVAMMKFVSEVLIGCQLDNSYPILVSLFMWQVYIGDHIYDSNKKGIILLARHKFYHKKTTLLILWLLLFFTLSIIAIRYFDFAFFYSFGPIVGVIFLLRVLLRKYPIISTLLIAFGYTLGIISPLFFSHESLFKSFATHLFIIQLTILAASNVIVLNKLEFEEDLMNGDGNIFIAHKSKYSYDGLAVVCILLQLFVTLYLMNLNALIILTTNTLIFGIGKLKFTLPKIFLKVSIELCLAVPFLIKLIIELFSCIYQSIAH